MSAKDTDEAMPVAKPKDKAKPMAIDKDAAPKVLFLKIPLPCI